MLRHSILLVFGLLLHHLTLHAQHVGIGTEEPAKLLSVAGSIAVDHNNTNTGTLDSAALVFGTNPSLVGIFSRKTPGTGSTNGLEFWTNGARKMFISETGTVGIGLENHDPLYDLHVGGNTKTYTLQAQTANIAGNAHITQEANVGYRVNINGNELASNYRLTVNDGDSYFDGYGRFTNDLTLEDDLSVSGSILSVGDIVSLNQLRGSTVRAADHMAVGGLVDPAYRLRVWDGSSRFGGPVQIVGTLDADNITAIDLDIDDMTADDIIADDIQIDKINGTGVVRSNGTSPLRIGFDDVWINQTLNGGSQIDLTVNISEFSGGPDDIRVFVSQFVTDPLPQYANWHDFSFHIHTVDPVNDTCKVRITNMTNANLSIRGTLYLSSIAKN